MARKRYRKYLRNAKLGKPDAKRRQDCCDGRVRELAAAAIALSKAEKLNQVAPYLAERHRWDAAESALQLFWEQSDLFIRAELILAGHVSHHQSARKRHHVEPTDRNANP